MAILAVVFAARRAARPRPAAIPVGPAEAPKLWQLVDELAVAGDQARGFLAPHALADVAAGPDKIFLKSRHVDIVTDQA